MDDESPVGLLLSDLKYKLLNIDNSMFELRKQREIIDEQIKWIKEKRT